MKVEKYFMMLVLLLGLLFVVIINSEESTDDFAELDDEAVDIETKSTSEPSVEKPKYARPEVTGNVFFSESFDSNTAIGSRWIKSVAKKDDTDADISKYDGQWNIEEPKDNPLIGDMGLVLKSKARHHAISANLRKPFDFKDKPFIVQYEVKFQNGQDCGGAYVKLLTEETKPNLENFFDKTPYTIMFGPDKCGNDNKLHFIFRHKNPVSGEFEEKHAKRPKSTIESLFTDKKTHLFTLVVNPDNTFEVLLDQNIVNSGSLLEDFEPAVNPPKEIIDPNDKKPKNWDEREKIPDPDATKPEDWDETEPEMIEDADAVKPEGWLDTEEELTPDPDAEKPSDWDDDMDGEWEAPKISNPKCEKAPGCGEWKRPQKKNPNYKGKWKAPLVDNPEYQGKWAPKKIANPDYFEDMHPFKMTSIGAVGLELWSMSDDIYFDNFLITDDRDTADKWAAQSWELKHEQELLASPSGKSVVQAVMDATRDRPWLWAVFILVVVLPLVLIIAYCCMSGSSTSEKNVDVARAKKTDEPVPDDNVEDENVNDESQEDDTTHKKKKASKSALEADDANEGDVEEEDDNEEKTKSRTSPRKRKTKPQKE